VIQRVLEVLAEHKLFLHLEKCEFDKLQIEYLKLVISNNQVKIDPMKVAEVCDWPVSKKYADLQAFLVFTNFY